MKMGCCSPLGPGLRPWRRGVTEVRAAPFGSLPTALLPEGSYIFFLVVTPAGSLAGSFLWETGIEIRHTDIVLPADDGVHGEKVEWWYWTGHLLDGAGRWYGFEQVFFLTRILGTRAMMAHGSLTDIQAGRFAYDVQVGTGLIEEVRDGFSFSLAGFRAEGGAGRDALRAETKGYVLDLALTATQPPLLHFHDGFEEFDFGGHTYYYSRARMAVAGTVVVDGETRTVSGTAWFDHQWGDLRRAVDVGWDWFGVQLHDGREIMIFIIRDRPDAPLVGGTMTAANGVFRELDSGEIDVRPHVTWTSPVTGCAYPLGWSVDVAGLSLEILPVLENQEIPAPITYWEGAAVVSGDAAGRAYVELTGYCE